MYFSIFNELWISWQQSIFGGSDHIHHSLVDCKRLLDDCVIPPLSKGGFGPTQEVQK